MAGWQRIYEERGRPRLVVCCAVDFSEASRAAALKAAQVAAGGRLYLVHVASARDDAALAEHGPVREPDPASAELRLFGWANAVTSRFPGTEVQTAVLGSGPAAEVVMEFAREHDCDLLVVGRKPRSTFGRATLGSVSEAILRSAPCPVLVMPPPAARELLAREGIAPAGRQPEVTAPPP